MINNNDNLPLCTDLDGTLIATDSVLEALILLIKSNPQFLLLLPFWLLKGKIFLKSKISTSYIPNPELLPYNEELIRFIKSEKSQGRKIYLATASHKLIAEKISDYLGIFDAVFASDNTMTVKGKAKANLLKNHFGIKGFDYVGDSRHDTESWKISNTAHFVNTSPKIINKIRVDSNIGKEFNFEQKKNQASLFIREIRVYQWVKNILLFLPIIMAHKIFDSNTLLPAVLGFVSLCLAASGVYIFNDIFDLEADRKHPRKKDRPITSGTMPLWSAIAIAPVFYLASILLSVLFLNPEFSLILILYILLTTLYSMFLKKVYIVDIITLAGLYTLRIIAGGLAATIEISTWILAFSMFIFLSLAILKRFIELKSLILNNNSADKIRGYFISDIDTLKNIGISSGIISILVLALYINSEQVIQLYGHPNVLWLAAPLLFYWITRIWLFADRGQVHDDPIVFTVKDPGSYIVAALMIIIIISASL